MPHIHLVKTTNLDNTDKVSVLRQWTTMNVRSWSWNKELQPREKLHILLAAGGPSNCSKDEWQSISCWMEKTKPRVQSYRVAEICKRVSRGTAVDTRPRNSDLWPSTKLQILTQASQSRRPSRHLRARHSLCCCLGAMSCGTGVTLLPILINSYTTPWQENMQSSTQTAKTKVNPSEGRKLKMLLMLAF